MRTLCVLVLLCLAGCPATDTYTSARTLPPGRMQFLAAGGGIAAPDLDASDTHKVVGWEVDPAMPTPGVRVGIVDGVDIGARAPYLAELGGDLKVRLLRGMFDIALDPGVVVFHTSEDNDNVDNAIHYFAGNVFWINAPVLVDLNLSRMVSLVASPGATYVFSTGAGSAAQLFATCGLGLNLRVFPWLSIQPQVSAVTAFRYAGDVFLSFGAGFSFGAQPRFDDL